MTDEEIEKALTDDGICSDCGGDGEQLNHENYKVFPCSACKGTGSDRLALLRATQAVGHLLRKLVAR